MTAVEAAGPSVRLRAPWLLVAFGGPHRVAGWPVVGPAWGEAEAAAILQVRDADLPPEIDPADHFRARARADGVAAGLGLMTAAEVGRYASARRAAPGGWATAVATAGLGNGESVVPGDAPMVTAPPHRVGTINVIAVLPRPLGDGALLEALSLVAEARTAAVLALGLALPDGRPVTGTGTDCIVVAAPVGADPLPCCGLHTATGRALAEAGHAAVEAAARDWLAWVRSGAA